MNPISIAAWMFTAGGNAAAMVAPVINDVMAMLPSQMHTISVRVWGDPTSTRDSLTFVAVCLIQSRFNNIVNGIPLSGAFYNQRSFKYTHDVMHKFVQVDAMLSTGPLATLFSAGLGPGVNPMQNQEYTFGITGGNVQGPYPRGSDLLFPLGINGQEQAARGTYLASIVTAALAPTYLSGGGVNSFFPPFNQPTEPLPVPRTLP